MCLVHCSFDCFEYRLYIEDGGMYRAITQIERVKSSCCHRLLKSDVIEARWGILTAPPLTVHCLFYFKCNHNEQMLYSVTLVCICICIYDKLHVLIWPNSFDVRLLGKQHLTHLKQSIWFCTDIPALSYATLIFLTLYVFNSNYHL